MQKVFLKTSDYIQIAANYFTVDKEKYEQPLGWIVFIHMMPATKESWTDFASEFQNIGYESLAIDLRGHGESVIVEREKGKVESLNFSEFTDKEHQKSNFDIETAVDYLKTKGAKPEKIAFIGASIGANLALQYISKHSENKVAVLFSPGLDYRGIKTEQAVKKLQPDQKVFLIGSKDDDSNDIETQQIFNEIPEEVKKEVKIFDIGGHGTNILNNHPELKQLIIKFIKND